MTRFKFPQQTFEYHGRLPAKIVVFFFVVLSLGLGYGQRSLTPAFPAVQAAEEMEWLPAVVQQLPIPAFPGAQGFGANTVGGRGGRVFEVTNLNDSGAGSLRECVEATVPRICVFRIGGTIALQSDLEIEDPYITIAGQTAPGGGITLKAADSNSDVHFQIEDSEVVVRYLRSRPGSRSDGVRALSINNGSSGADAVHNVVIDHSSFSWTGDELTITWLQTNHVTMQWNVMAESLPGAPETGSVGLKGPNLGGVGGGFFSFHHNLVAHHTQRSPLISASGGPVDVVNNVVYNPGRFGSTVKDNASVNFVGNYIKSGPNTRVKIYVRDEGAAGFYIEENVLAGTIQGFLPSTDKVSPVRFNAPVVSTTSAQTAYNQVLQTSGAAHGLNCDGSWFPRRDAVDTRIIQSVMDGSRGHSIPPEQTFNQLGYISDPADVGGYPQLAPGTPCTDDDHDGMPDTWEIAHFGNSSRGSALDSSSDFDSDGYTDLEEYLNGTNPKIADTSIPSNTPTNTATATGTPISTNTPTPSNTPTNTATATGTPISTNTPTPSSTPTNTPTPSRTPSPTSTPPPSSGALYLSLDASNGSITANGDVVLADVRDEDIVYYDGSAWSMLVDGSDIGLGGTDIEGFYRLDVDSFLMAVSNPVTLGSLAVDTFDIVRFDATSLGNTTAGSFSLYFDGNDVGLTASGEKIDAFTLLADGRLLISTTGNPAVTGVTSARDEDLLAFMPTALGTNTSGSWAMYLDGSNVGLGETSGEDVDGVAVANGVIYLTTLDAFAVSGVSGADEDVFGCTATMVGNNRSCTYAAALAFDGSAWGLAANDVDGVGLP
jgi:hypothetical protein